MNEYLSDDSQSLSSPISTEKPVEKRLRYLVIAGLIQVLLIVFISAASPNLGVEVFGMRVIKVGNRKLAVNPPPGTRAIVDEKEIKQRWPDDDLPFLLIVGDASNPKFPTLSAQIFQNDGSASMDSLFTLLSVDSTSTIVSCDRSNDCLTVIRRVGSSRPDSAAFVYNRFWLCFPYTLRLQCVWFGQDEKPALVSRAIEGVTVSK